MSVTDRTDPYEIIGVRRDASLAEIRISYRRSTQILAPERFANANETVRADVSLQVGQITEQVTVLGQSPLVEVTQAIVASFISSA